uniref:hypothetical protein n=1 Tax=Nocardioides jensenii TaxID=1843 RepID=UPI000B0A2894
PRRNLRGTWRIRLRPGTDSESDPVVRVQARLLVQGPRRPVVLLWGGLPDGSRLPDPHPRPTPQAATSARTARALAHRALSVLPERRAEQVRRQVRRLRG